ncbi:MAG: multifunctional CCA addition/repair protein [Gammaproteobacteria bacterium]|nr:multifunctional CCA addition/repair protein [Gammaproteobacteria bacterium]
MQFYLVGGAVRDKLLNYPVKDKDWLVTGATIDQMLELGYQQVGKSFPVFLHPENNQEYALARTEQKQGQGYTGFVCDFSPEITVEQDLYRRDLTINAMAESETGEIIDPFNGQQDIKSRLLRHVSDAFIEDPLRVLRVARFAARYHHLGFTIATETLALMTEISRSGELTSLTPERIWQETHSALTEKNPRIYFETLKQTGALKALFPEVDVLWGIPNPAKWHPEIDTGIHTMMVLEQACLLSEHIPVRFAALVHDLGKGLTPAEEWPSHHGHELKGKKPITELCDRIKVPNDCKELALLVSEFHTHTHKAFELKPATVIKLFNKVDVWRKPERFEQFLQVCTADMRGRTGFENSDYPQTDYLRKCAQACRAVQARTYVEQGLKGSAIKTAMDSERLNLVQDIKLQSLPV